MPDARVPTSSRARRASDSAVRAPSGPVAVIAGTRNLALSNVTSWTVGRRFPAGVANDGTVAVDETKLDDMAAFREVDATHTWIMNSTEARRLVLTYLREGCF